MGIWGFTSKALKTNHIDNFYDHPFNCRFDVEENSQFITFSGNNKKKAHIYNKLQKIYHEGKKKLV